MTIRRGGEEVAGSTSPLTKGKRGRLRVRFSVIASKLLSSQCQARVTISLELG